MVDVSLEADTSLASHEAVPVSNSETTRSVAQSFSRPKQDKHLAHPPPLQQLHDKHSEGKPKTSPAGRAFPAWKISSKNGSRDAQRPHKVHGVVVSGRDSPLPAPDGALLGHEEHVCTYSCLTRNYSARPSSRQCSTTIGTQTPSCALIFARSYKCSFRYSISSFNRVDAGRCRSSKLQLLYATPGTTFSSRSV